MFLRHARTGSVQGSALAALKAQKRDVRATGPRAAWRMQTCPLGTRPPAAPATASLVRPSSSRGASDGGDETQLKPRLRRGRVKTTDRGIQELSASQLPRAPVTIGAPVTSPTTYCYCSPNVARSAEIGGGMPKSGSETKRKEGSGMTLASSGLASKSLFRSESYLLAGLSMRRMARK